MVIRITFYLLIVIIKAASYYEENTKDQTSTRANTLFDDADDIQKQLNNEARDRMMFGKPETVWVLHLQTKHPLRTRSRSGSKRIFKFPQYHEVFQRTSTTTNLKRYYFHKVNAQPENNWSYKDQCIWYKHYPACGGHSQSPVDLPAVGLIQTKGCRLLNFLNYDVVPNSLTLKNNGKQLILYGEWECNHKPAIYGGAAHSRRYLFHSITLRWPSEHQIGGMQYPLESQVIHISADYKTVKEAVEATPRDGQAILGVVNFYKYSNETQQGLEEILRRANSSRNKDVCMVPRPLACFNPSFKEYVVYQGSLTVPPCTENVLWLIRARALPVTREMVDVVYNLNSREPRGSFIRQPQPLNDRKVFFFN